jgi:hypothetical protein
MPFGDRIVHGSLRCTRGLAMMLGAGVVLGACNDEAPRSMDSGSLSGQVVVSGPLRKAAISIDQLDQKAPGAVAVRAHITDTMTDDDGRFSVEVGTYNGLLLLTASGGSFQDLATGATIQLDTNTSLETITRFALFDERDDVLVSPVGALIAARTRGRVTELGNVVAAERDAAEHLDRHFGTVVDWSHVKLGSLETSTTSPTEPVRAAFVQAALSFLARDIAAESGASPQEVNVLTLTQRWAVDAARDPFDGNDHNALAFGEGLQLGVCERLTTCHTLPAGDCELGACRPACDLYAGTRSSEPPWWSGRAGPSRETRRRRCPRWLPAAALHLRAPPLHFQKPGQGLPDPDPIPVDHPYRLLSLNLGVAPPLSAIAARLLNADASGASVLDEDVTNGTASTVYLEVGVTRPATVQVRQNFKLANVITTQTVSIDCTDFGDGPPDPLCKGPTAGPTYSSANLGDQPISGLSFPVKVFELDGSLHPAIEVPCLVCGGDGGDRWKFAIPPRPVDASGSLPPRRFKVMTMISQVSLLWPSDSNFPATAPFVDTSLNNQPFTGRLSPTSDGCTSHNIRTLPDGTRLDTCTRVSHITPYRALTQVRLNTLDRFQSTYATAPTSASTPENATQPQQSQSFNWDSSAAALP